MVYWQIGAKKSERVELDIYEKEISQLCIDANPDGTTRGL